MITVLGFNDAGVTGLMIVQRPVLESVNIVGVRRNVLIQATGGAITVIRLGVCQFGETFLGGISGFPLGEDFFRGGLCSCLLLIGISGGTGSLIRGAAFEGNQNVAHIGQGEGVVGAANVVYHIISVGGGHFFTIVICRSGGASKVRKVAFLTTFVSQPVHIQGVDGTVQCRIVCGAGCLGIGIDGKLRNGGIQCLYRVNLFAGQLLCGFFGSGDGCVGLFLGVGGIAVLIRGATGQETAGSQIVGLIGVGGIGVVIFRFRSPQIFIRIGQGIGVVFLVSLGQSGGFAVVLIAVQIRTLTIDCLQVSFPIGIAIQGGIDIQRGDVGLNGACVLFGKGKALSLRCIYQRIYRLGGTLCGGQEVISPGASGFLVGDLLIQGLCNVQAEHGGVAAIGRVEIVDGVHVEVIQFCIAQLVGAHGQRNGVLFTNTAVDNGLPHTYKNGHGKKQNHNHNKSGCVQADLFGLLLSGLLLFCQLGGVLLFPELFLVGCTHVIISSRLSQWFLRQNA